MSYISTKALGEGMPWDFDPQKDMKEKAAAQAQADADTQALIDSQSRLSAEAGKHAAANAAYNAANPQKMLLSSARTQAILDAVAKAVLNCTTVAQVASVYQSALPRLQSEAVLQQQLMAVGFPVPSANAASTMSALQLVLAGGTASVQASWDAAKAPAYTAPAPAASSGEDHSGTITAGGGGYTAPVAESGGGTNWPLVLGAVGVLGFLVMRKKG